jgi:hypothetical protein
LSYFISTNNLQLQNVPMFVFMSILILADLMWNVFNGCTDTKYLGLSLIIGGGIGVGWAAFIEMNAPSVAYFSGVDKNTCQQPTKGLYRCRATKNTNGTAVGTS